MYHGRKVSHTIPFPIEMSPLWTVHDRVGQPVLVLSVYTTVLYREVETPEIVVLSYFVVHYFESFPTNTLWNGQRSFNSSSSFCSCQIL